MVELNPQVEQYLEEHMMKCLTQKTTLLKRPVARSKSLRRRMSVKGAIKKTRSIINIERKYYTFLYNTFKSCSLLFAKCVHTLNKFMSFNFIAYINRLDMH